jgi:glycosyltransferase involved in cell wall biosynthesis
LVLGLIHWAGYGLALHAPPHIHNYSKHHRRTAGEGTRVNRQVRPNPDTASKRREKIRILHMGPDPTRPGGMSAVLRDLLNSPLADTYQLDVIPTYRTPRPLGRLLAFARALPSLARWCAGRGRRLVHVHTAVRGSLYRKSLCVAVAKCARRPVVLHVHAGAGDIHEFASRLGPIRLRLFSAAFRAADRVLSVSTEGARSIERIFGADEVLFVPNAAPRISLRGLQQADGDRSFPVRLLYMGGFADPAKGGAELVRALPAIASLGPRTEITLAGPGAPPPELVSLLAADAGIAWAGWLDETAKERALKTCDVFVMPSLSEGLPVALLEAMAYGRAIIASAVGGIVDVLTEGVDAVLVPPADNAELVRAVEALIDDPGRRWSLGANARERAERLNREDVCDRIDILYRELLG